MRRRARAASGHEKSPSIEKADGPLHNMKPESWGLDRYQLFGLLGLLHQDEVRGFSDEALQLGQLLREVVIRILPPPYYSCTAFEFRPSAGLRFGHPCRLPASIWKPRQPDVFQRAFLGFRLEIRDGSPLLRRVCHPLQRTASLAHVLQDDAPRGIDTMR